MDMFKENFNAISVILPNFSGFLEDLKKISEFNISHKEKKQIQNVQTSLGINDVDNDLLACKDDIAITLARINTSVKKETPTFEEILAGLRVNNIPVKRKELTVTECIELLKAVKEKNKESNG